MVSNIVPGSLVGAVPISCPLQVDAPVFFLIHTSFPIDTGAWAQKVGL